MNTLCLFPNTRGIAYSFVKVPERLMEFGVITSNPLDNTRLLLRVKKLIELYQPDTILIRAPIANNQQNSRINELISSVTELVKEKDIPIHGYTREQIRDTFALWGATTKHEIAQHIISWFPQLASYAPEIRKPWNSEEHYMGVFDSLALLAVHVNVM